MGRFCSLFWRLKFNFMLLAVKPINIFEYWSFVGFISCKFRLITLLQKWLIFRLVPYFIPSRIPLLSHLQISILFQLDTTTHSTIITRLTDQRSLWWLCFCSMSILYDFTTLSWVSFMLEAGWQMWWGWWEDYRVF